MSFNDDEPIVTPPDSGPRPAPLVAGRVQLTIINNQKAPLDENKQKVLLELAGADSTNDRPGLDLIAALDISGSMRDKDKIGKMKKAMLLVIKKLSSIDRLSIVTFSTTATRLCPLRQITETSQLEFENLVKGLVASGATNVTGALQIGMKVLSERKLNDGRVVGIILMSDGEQNRGGDAAQVELGSVPVYTFGFGVNHDPRVLKAVADKSLGGTFSDVQNADNLGKSFSMCLAGLLTVVAQDLKLTVTGKKDESRIEQVWAGNYPKTSDDPAVSVTISFGDLYSREVRKVIVDLHLLRTPSDRSGDILQTTYSYSIGGKLFTKPPSFVTVRRTLISADQEDMPEVVMEETRLRTAKMFKEARTMADDKKLDNARDKLVEAENSLEDVTEKAKPIVELLKTELQQLQNFMRSQDVYEKQGRPFALSSETSHARQRFAARGDMDSLRMFSTPRMDKYLEQAKKFDEDPSQPLPTVEEDAKEETTQNPVAPENPLAPIAGSISYYLQIAIQALQCIEKIIENKNV